MSSRVSLIFVAAALALAACDPEGPGAEGILTLSGVTDTSSFTTLEMRMFPDVDGRFDLAGPPPVPAEESSETSSVAMPLVFPYEYQVGGSIGMTGVSAWRIVVWLATPATTTWPNGSEPFATKEVAIADCGAGGDYCGVTHGVDLALAPPGT
jgi:hypothetical protein